MLENKIDTCIGCCIALCNAMNQYDEDIEAMNHIVSCIKDLKYGNTYDWVSVLREDKKRIVPDCFTCMNPCGRTSEISMNELGESYCQKALKIIENIDSMSLEEVYRAIGTLPYNF